MKHNRSMLTAGILSLFLALAMTGCGDTDSENSDQSVPPRDVGTSSGSDLPEFEDGASADSSRNSLLLQWCSAKSGREEASCACIIAAVEGALESADYLILSEVAAADLADGSSEEAIEAEFNAKYGADRMAALMETFVSKRAEAEKTCPISLESGPGPQGT